MGKKGQRTQRWAASLAAGLAALLLVAAAPARPGPGQPQELGRAFPVPGARGTAPSVELEFTRLNRAYRDVAGAAAPVEAGPLRVELASPSQEVTLLRHVLRLSRRGDGTHDVDLRARFRGRGVLEARVSALGLGQTFRDDVTVPEQEKVLRGTARIQRVRGGYLFTAVSLPPHVEVELRSRLAGEVVGWCENLAALPLSPVECGGLERALSRASVPLPPPGETHLLADAELTPDDRRRLDAYLGAAGR